MNDKLARQLSEIADTLAECGALSSPLSKELFLEHLGRFVDVGGSSGVILFSDSESGADIRTRLHMQDGVPLVKRIDITPSSHLSAWTEKRRIVA